MSALVVALVSLGLLLVLGRQLSKPERIVLIVGWGLRLLAAFGQVSITQLVYGGGDMLSYDRLGREFADMMRGDLGRYGPEVLRLLVQLPNDLPLSIQGGSTSSMFAVSALLNWALGSALFAHCAFLAMFAFSGMSLGWLAIREWVPEAMRVRLMLAYLMMPSVVFWSAGILKETLAMGFLGLLVWAALRIAQGRFALGVPVFVGATWGVSLFKAYLLFPVASGLLAAWYVQRSAARGGITLRPVRLGLALVLAWAAVVGLGQLFPRYAIDTLDEEVERLQTIGARVEGGSNFRSGAPTGRLFAQVPTAIVTTLARPFPFEARSTLSAVASVEITGLVLFLVVGIWRTGPRRLVVGVLRDPVATFVVAAVLVGAVGIGLGTSNMGTLSRYRMPLLPWYAMFAFGLLWVGERRDVPSGPEAVAPHPPVHRETASRRTPVRGLVVRSRFVETLEPADVSRAQLGHLPVRPAASGSETGEPLSSRASPEA